jgi:DNA (cytosine-5)-methyltransferase 1
MTLRIASLFSGTGGLDLAVEHVTGGSVVLQCERDPWRRRVLERRWPRAQRFDDVCTLHGIHRGVDIVCGGFPCTDVSNAGPRTGIAGARSRLWLEMARIIGGTMPTLVFVENVEALRSRGLAVVLADLVELGYDVEWTTLRAWDAGAPHQRDRIWIVGRRDDRSVLPVRWRTTFDFPPDRAASPQTWAEWLRRNPRCEPGIPRDSVPTTLRKLRQAALGDGVCVPQAIAAYQILLSPERAAMRGRPFATLETSGWNTVQTDLFETSTVPDEWPRAGSVRRRVALEQSHVLPPAPDVADGLWPTPTAADYSSSQNGINGVGGEHERPSAGTPSLSTIVRRQMWATPTASDTGVNKTRLDGRAGRRLGNDVQAWPTPLASDAERSSDAAREREGGEGPNLPTAVRSWPTPVAAEAEHNASAGRENLTHAVKAWPTPTTTDANDAARHATTTGVMHPGTMMLDAVREHVGQSASPVVVNPRFVEALMGLPPGWTDVEPSAEDLTWLRAERKRLEQERERRRAEENT